MDYQVGKCYVVHCAEIRLKEDGRVYAIPVFDEAHTDTQFNFPHRHYHIDGRFEIHPRMRHRLKIDGGLTRTVILADGSNTYDFTGLVSHTLKCERAETGLSFPGHTTNTEGLALYEQWYAAYMGSYCKGRKCPHLGTAMLEKDGVLVCPMHNLTADIPTLRIIERVK